MPDRIGVPEIREATVRVNAASEMAGERTGVDAFAAWAEAQGIEPDAVGRWAQEIATIALKHGEDPETFGSGVVFGFGVGFTLARTHGEVSS